MKFPYKDIVASECMGYRIYGTPENNYYPSITTVLGNTVGEEKKAALEKWRNSLGHEAADKFTREAASAGTNVHLLIERYLKKEDLIQGDSFSVHEMSMFKAIKMDLNKIDEVWGQEVPLYSDRLGVAGRCDCVGVYKGIKCIIDFKTSSRIKSTNDIEDYYLQLCAYAQMHNEMFGTNISNGIILMTSAGGFPQRFSVDLT